MKFREMEGKSTGAHQCPQAKSHFSALIVVNIVGKVNNGVETTLALVQDMKAEARSSRVRTSSRCLNWVAAKFPTQTAPRGHEQA